MQLAVNPVNGDMVIIEMNPRVSRSSALASKATGFPIAKFAAKLAMGFTLDQIPNDITQYVLNIHLTVDQIQRSRQIIKRCFRGSLIAFWYDEHK